MGDGRPDPKESLTTTQYTAHSTIPDRVPPQDTRGGGGIPLFSDAYQTCAGFTRPVVISHVLHDGTCSSSIGAYIVLNPDGWIATAKHLVQGIADRAEAKKGYDEANAKVEAVEGDPNLSASQRRRRLRKLVIADSALRDYSTWWGVDGVGVVDAEVAQDVDFAFGRLEPFDSDWVPEYPRFKDPSQPMVPGEALCKLGYPFHSVTPEYSTDPPAFKLPEGSVPPPLFPIEGIFTREYLVRDHPEGFQVKYLETSSPGLRGQSGGPIFDQQGTIWALQSMTRHYPLGFQPEVEEHKEHQFLNVGVGVHAETVVGILSASGIDFELSDY